MNRQERKQLEKEEIIKVLRYFRDNKLEENDDEIINNLEQSIAKVLKLELDNLEMNIKFDESNPEDIEKNDIVLYFINSNEVEGNDFSKSFKQAGGFVPQIDGKPYIELSKDYFYNYLKSDNSAVRLYIANNIFQSLLHEIRHYQQYLMTKQCVSSREAMMFAKDYIIAGFAPEVYKDSYKSFAIENDANASSEKEFQEIFGEEEHSQKSKVLYEGERDTGMYTYETIDRRGNIQKHMEEREEVTQKLIDYIICNEKIEEVFKFCPILLKEYNEDFTKKSTCELISNMKGEVDFLARIDFLEEDDKQKLIKNAQEMYYDMIYRSLLQNKEERKEIPNEFDKDEIVEILHNMKENFNEERDFKIGQAEKKWKVQSDDELKEELELKVNRIKAYYKFREDFLDSMETDLFGKKEQKDYISNEDEER